MSVEAAQEQHRSFVCGRVRLLSGVTVAVIVGVMACSSVPVASADDDLGAARRWGVGMAVGPYGEVNLETGRVVTTLPVTGWGGRGPGVSFALYHNMGLSPGVPDGFGGIGDLSGLGDVNTDGSVNGGDVDGFVAVLLDPSPDPALVARCDYDFDTEADVDDVPGFIDALLDGAGWRGRWTHSYSRHLIIEPEQVTLVWDDGTVDVFTADGQGGYDAPVGVFAQLTQDDPPDGYTLTTKSHARVHFDADGRLDWIADATWLADPEACNKITFEYVDFPGHPLDGRLEYINDASGRTLWLEYTAQARLIRVTDPESRYWHLLYCDGRTPGEPHADGTGPLAAFEDPMAFHVDLTYSVSGAIETIANKNGNAWVFTYTNSGALPLPGVGDRRLAAVTDPAPFDHQTQHFEYVTDAPGIVEARYTDRRGEEWLVTFDESSGNLLSWTDPLNHTQHLAYGDPRPQLAHERTAYTSALGRTWSFDYDDAGNVLAVTDPMQHRWTYTYDALNSVTAVTPPGETPLSGNPAKQVTYAYDDLDHPTNVTRVDLPADGQGNPAASVDLVYYGDEEPEAYGLLKSVTDANDVETELKYDQYGQHRRTTEGPITEVGSEWLKVVEDMYSDAVGNLLTSWRGEIPTNNPPRGSCEEDDPSRVCKLSNCQSYYPDGALAATCCCCILWCGNGPCHPDDLPDCSSRGSSCGSNEKDEAGSNVRAGPFACPPFIVSGTTEGPGYFNYDHNGRLIDLESWYTDDSVWPTTEFDIDMMQSYDSLDRMQSSTLSTDEPTWGTPQSNDQINRYFNYDYDDVNGIYERTGPDGQITHMEMDISHRVESVSRSDISAVYTYHANNQVDTITYGNGTRTVYEYDDAERLTQIRHEWLSDQSLILQLGYCYTADGLVQTIAEDGPDGWSATTTYSYDNRNRLIEEERVGTQPYHLLYSYDQGGNRLSKADWLTGTVTQYHYDLENPAEYRTKNNRLMYYEVFDGVELVEHVDYVYDTYGTAVGHPSLIVREVFDPVGPSMLYATDLQYNKRGELWFVAQRQWSSDDEFCDNQEIVHITEFRGTGRNRYMVRQRDNEPGLALLVMPGTSQWSDYDGNWIYGDYSVDEDTGDVIDTTAYLPGIGWMNTQSSDVMYVHNDQIGSLRAVSTEYGQPIHLVVYTAFGEKVYEDGNIETPYQYAGTWGYQLSNQIPFIHIGHRYYDPSTGRFLQRDPIGIQAWPNVYVYVGNNPLLTIDPYGLLSWTGFKTGAAKGYLWITGGRRSWLDDPVKVKKVQRASRWVAKEAALTACGVGIASHLSKLRHLRWLNQNRYLRIGPGAHKGKRYHRIVIGREGGRVHWHIPVTRLRPFH